MKLPIKKEYFDAIKKGHKNLEFRDAHLTFICEETGRTMTKFIKKVELIEYYDIPSSLKDRGLFEDGTILKFELE